MLYKWTTASLDPCPGCSRLSGHVHPLEDWYAAGLYPGCELIGCDGSCKSTLNEEFEEGETSEDLSLVREAITGMLTGQAIK